MPSFDCTFTHARHVMMSHGAQHLNKRILRLGLRASGPDAVRRLLIHRAAKRAGCRARWSEGGSLSRKESQPHRTVLLALTRPAAADLHTEGDTSGNHTSSLHTNMAGPPLPFLPLLLPCSSSAKNSIFPLIKEALALGAGPHRVKHGHRIRQARGTSGMRGHGLRARRAERCWRPPP